MFSSTSSWEPRTTSDATARTWLRTPFGPRGQRHLPARPLVEHGHEVARYQPPPLV